MFNINDRYLDNGRPYLIGSIGYCSWLNHTKPRIAISLYTRLTILVARGASPPA